MSEDLQAVRNLLFLVGSQASQHVRKVRRPFVELVQLFFLQVELIAVAVCVHLDVAAGSPPGLGAPLVVEILLLVGRALLRAPDRRGAGITAEGVVVAETAGLVADLQRLRARLDALCLRLGDAAKDEFPADLLLALAGGRSRLDILDHLIIRHLRIRDKRQRAEQRGCNQRKSFHIQFLQLLILGI